MPNTEQLISMLRQLLLVLGGGLVARGYLDDQTSNGIAGALAILIGSAWALYTRRNAGLVTAAAAVADVDRIVASGVLADAVPSTKVVGREGA